MSGRKKIQTDSQEIREVWQTGGASEYCWSTIGVPYSKQFIPSSRSAPLQLLRTEPHTEESSQQGVQKASWTVWTLTHLQVFFRFITDKRASCAKTINSHVWLSLKWATVKQWSKVCQGLFFTMEFFIARTKLRRSQTRSKIWSRASRR